MSLPGHKRSALSVAITPDGRRIVSGGADGTFRIWDLETGEELWTLQADQLAVRSVAVAPDGSPHAVSAGQNESIRVWNIESGAEEGSPGESAIWHGR
jgi:WD40 repeat protein